MADYGYDYNYEYDEYNYDENTSAHLDVNIGGSDNNATVAIDSNTTVILHNATVTHNNDLDDDTVLRLNVTGVKVWDPREQFVELVAKQLWMLIPSGALGFFLGIFLWFVTVLILGLPELFRKKSERNKEMEMEEKNVYTITK